VLTGYHQVPHAITKAPSAHKSNYSFSKRVRLAVDHLTAFSDSLLYASFFFGLAVSAIAFLMTMYFVTLYLRTGLVLAGWTSIIASVWMFGGASLFLIGLVGIYVARIFNETKRRPYAIVRELYAAGDREEPTPSLMQDNEKPKVRSS
jgi:putative glycosyltransferase